MIKVSTDKPKNLAALIRHALRELSCSDFNPLKSNADLKKGLEDKLSLTNPYWIIGSNEFHESSDHTFLLHIIPKDQIPQKPSKGDFFAKIKIEENSIVLEHLKMLDALNSETIGLISFSKKDLFKDCNAFIEQFEIILKESIDLRFAEQM